MIRRRFLTLLAAPAVITTAGLLMPVRASLWAPQIECVSFDFCTDIWSVTYVGDPSPITVTAKEYHEGRTSRARALADFGAPRL